ncbi:MAG TPA: GNAT family N-acetyltransferase [Solirubrobacterales bacterium]
MRVATERDLDRVTETLTAAFADDPLWSWAFPEREILEAWWRFHVSSALRYPWVLVADDGAAASVWIPPGGVELTEDEEHRVEPLLHDLVGSRAPDVLELLDRFERSHPDDEPHYYLSLLGTHPDHRGKGAGMALLADGLTRIDAERMPAYLESSNSANDPRYERLGFERVGEFRRPDEAVTVSTMWREPGAGRD